MYDLHHCYMVQLSCTGHVEEDVTARIILQPHAAILTCKEDCKELTPSICNFNLKGGNFKEYTPTHKYEMWDS